MRVSMMNLSRTTHNAQRTTLILLSMFLFTFSFQSLLSNGTATKLNDATCGNCNGRIQVISQNCDGIYGGKEFGLYIRELSEQYGHFVLRDIPLRDYTTNGTFNHIINDLCPGTYNVTFGVYILAGTSMSILFSEVITIEGASEAVNVSVQSGIGDCDRFGFATLSVTSGVAPFTLRPCGATIGQYITGNSITLNNLTQGDHCYVITDANGCSKEVTFNIPTTNWFDFQLDNNFIDCYDPEDSGTASVTAISANDNLPLWSTGAKSWFVENLTEGDYWVEYTRNGCTIRKAFHIKRFHLPDIEYVKTDANCNGNGGGTIEFLNQNQTFNWNNEGASSSEYKRTNLAPGFYTIRVWKDIRCWKEVIVEVKASLDYTLEYEITQVPDCNNPDGLAQASVYIINGNPPFSIVACDASTPIPNYTYKFNTQYNLWEFAFAGLNKGHYCFIVKGNTDCPPKKIEFDIDWIDPISFGMSAKDKKDINNVCYSEGSVSIQAPNTTIPGRPPFTVKLTDGSIITWDGTLPAPIDIIYGFPATHSFEITDANGCIMKQSITNNECNLIGIVGAFPVPTNGSISVLQAFGDQVINPRTCILNMEGTSLIEFEHSGSYSEGTYTFLVDISSLPTGLYYIIAKHNDRYIGESTLIIKE